MQKPKLRLTGQIFQFAIEALEAALNYVTFGVFGIIVSAIRDFSRHRSLESAASIAYYAIFSLFPLLLILVTILSLIVDPVLVKAEMIRLVQEFFPFTGNTLPALASLNLETILGWSGPVSIIAGVGLLWAGSNVFAVLARNINRAWRIEKPLYGYWRSRAIGFITIFILFVLLLMSLLANLALNIIAQLQIGNIAVDETIFWILLSKILSYFFTFVLFLGIYRWVPNTEVRWSEAAWAALAAMVSWRLAMAVFGWASNQGFMNYHLVYGSLATVVLAIFWIYLGSAILIFCAYVSAAIAQHRQAALE